MIKEQFIYIYMYIYIYIYVYIYISANEESYLENLLDITTAVQVYSQIIIKLWILEVRYFKLYMMYRKVRNVTILNYTIV